MEKLAADDPPWIGSYRVLRRLGRGGMGRVYLARSAGGRTVAVKVVHREIAADPTFRARFAREVAAARLVGAEWTAPVLDADPDAGVPWVVTGYVAGPDLDGAVRAHGALPVRTVRTLGAGLAEALTAVHGRGLVHRDVKPSNVLLSLEGPRLIDFGIARAAGGGTAQLTATGGTVGSPGYMSPEQVMAREIGPASDVFSFGAVLAFAAGGYAPFPGDTPAQLLYQVVHEEPRLEAVPAELRELVGACLAKDPAARPTPDGIARACGGEGGASALVAPGWLPQPVVEDVSRRAVELLDLEAEAVPAPGTTQQGAFGPPVPTQASTHVSTWATPPPAGPYTPVPTPSATPRPPTAVPGAGRSRRRLAVPLAAAALVVAALVAGAYLTGVLGGDDEGGGGGRGQALPDPYLGEWSGDMEIGLGISSGPMDITLEAGRVGERVGTVISSDVLGLSRCVDRLTLTAVEEDVLHFDSEIDQAESEGGASVCVQEKHQVTLRLDEQGVLHYASPDQNSPTAELRKNA